VVDTSDLSLRQLKERIFAHLADSASDAGIVFQLISFGFKYGVPLEADLVFDVRSWRTRTTSTSSGTCPA